MEQSPLGTMKIFVTTTLFKLTLNRGHWRITSLSSDSTPGSRRVSARDAGYLKSLNPKPTVPGTGPICEFDMACVWDFGLAVFQKPSR